MSPPVARHEKRRVDLFGERLRSRTPQLSPRLLTVVNWIDDNREAVLDHTAMEIAAATQTSDATVVRAIQALGFAGLRDLKQTMQHWFGPTISSAEKMVTTVAALTLISCWRGTCVPARCSPRRITVRRLLRRWHY